MNFNIDSFNLFLGKREYLKSFVSDKELCYLLKSFSTTIVIGVKDLTHNLLEAELQTIRKIAEDDLKDKGILITEGQDQPQIASPLKEMLQTITHPVHAILVGLHSNGNSQVHSFHYNPDMTLVHMATSDQEQYELSVLENRVALIDQILSFHTALPQYQQPFEPACLLKDAIDQARAFSQSNQLGAAVELLISAGLEKNTAQAYTETIQSPVLTMPLLAYCNMNDQPHLHVKGFITESNNDHLWIIEIIDEDLAQVRLTHATRSMLKEKLDTILP